MRDAGEAADLGDVEATALVLGDRADGGEVETEEPRRRDSVPGARHSAEGMTEATTTKRSRRVPLDVVATKIEPPAR